MTNSFSDEDIVHHSVTSIPRISANMEALEARTFGAADLATRNQQLDALGDRDSFPKALDPSRNPRPQPGPLRSKRSAWEITTTLSQNWLIAPGDFTTGKTIGHSSCGTVTEGRFRGTKVAVKTILRDARPDVGDDFLEYKKEAELNCRLRHPNIVLFIGISIEPTRLCILTEFMCRGNVRNLLVDEKNGNKEALDWSLRLQWGLDTARGMAYLHSHDPPMIHRDLKTTNLLVDRGMNVKICDFGLSRLYSSMPMSSVGTVQFSAPEVLKQERYSEKIDVFSFGTVLWELYSREVVFQGVSQLAVYTSVVEGRMPAVDDKCDPRFERLLKECWSLDPSRRPQFEEIIDRLCVLVEELENCN